MRIKVKTYDELKRFIAMFRDNERLQLLVIASGPGQGKTSLIRQEIPDSVEMSGRVTAAKLYDLLWEHKDKLIFFDDLDDIYKDRQSVVILKMLCQTEKVKRLQWQTRTRSILRVSPDEFDTSSRVILLTNKWETLSEHITAVEDRGIVIEFCPTGQELHDYILTLSVTSEIDSEVYQFIGEYLPFVPIPSIRRYLTCTALKVSGMDWRNAYFQSIGMDTETAIVWQLMQSVSDIKERKRIFCQQTGKTERTYYRIEKRLKERG